jgi:hypothetical protein
MKQHKQPQNPTNPNPSKVPNQAPQRDLPQQKPQREHEKKRHGAC